VWLTELFWQRKREGGHSTLLLGVTQEKMINGRDYGGWMFYREYEFFGGGFSKAYCLITQPSPGGMSEKIVLARFVT
jgi:hypothetical protein